jgi:HEAT repeat protein
MKRTTHIIEQSPRESSVSLDRRDDVSPCSPANCGAGFQPAHACKNACTTDSRAGDEVRARRPRPCPFHRGVWSASLRNALASALVLMAVTVSNARAETGAAKVDRLFMMASSGEVRFQSMVQPAKDSLAAMGEIAAIGLVRKLNATDARERLTLADIFAAIGPVAVAHVAPYLDSAGEYMPMNAARCLGRIADTSATLALLPKLSHNLYAVRSEVATALGKIADPRAVGDLIARLSDESDCDVRKSCAVALGEIGDSCAAPTLVDCLADPFFGVRQSAQTALTKLDPPPVTELVTAIHRSSGVARYGAIVALGSTGDDRARGFLLNMLQSDDPFIRGFSVEGLINDSTATTREQIVSLKGTETDPFVRAQIDRWESIRQ